MGWGKKDKIKRQDFTEEIADKEEVEEAPMPKLKARPYYEEVEKEEEKEYYKPEETEEYKPRLPIPKPVQKEAWSLTEVSTNSTIAIVNNKTGKVYDVYSALVELLNRTED